MNNPECVAAAGPQTQSVGNKHRRQLCRAQKNPKGKSAKELFRADWIHVKRAAARGGKYNPCTKESWDQFRAGSSSNVHLTEVILVYWYVGLGEVPACGLRFILWVLAISGSSVLPRLALFIV